MHFSWQTLAGRGYLGNPYQDSTEKQGMFENPIDVHVKEVLDGMISALSEG